MAANNSTPTRRIMLIVPETVHTAILKLAQTDKQPRRRARAVGHQQYLMLLNEALLTWYREAAQRLAELPEAQREVAQWFKDHPDQKRLDVDELDEDGAAKKTLGDEWSLVDRASASETIAQATDYWTEVRAAIAVTLPKWRR